MMKLNVRLFGSLFRRTCLVAVLALMLGSCSPDDPAPVNEEEVITTIQVTLSPAGGGVPVTLKFVDADGEQGSIVPIITASGSLRASTTYTATAHFLNETVTPTEDITLEVEEESGDHILCFDSTPNITIEYADTDPNGLPLGLATTWLTGQTGPAEVTLSLRHQAGTKTGDCPGVGETDVEVTFEVSVE